MRSLFLKLTLSFLLISVVAALLVGLFSRLATSREFDRLVSQQATENFVAAAAQYYAENGSWAGASETLRDGPPLPVGVPEAGRGPRFVLVDLNQNVVVGSGNFQTGQRMRMMEMMGMMQSSPVVVNGQRVGTVYGLGNPRLEPREIEYVRRLQNSLWLAALGSALAALVLGVFLARNLTRPVRELTQAIRSMAQGDLHQTVPVRSQDELGELAAAFNHMSQEMAHANHLRRQMTADIAHDLRTPLTVLNGYLEALRDGVLPPSTERYEVMYSEVRHLTHLVEDLRTLSLADAGELSMQPQAVQPRLLLEQTAAAFQHQAAQQQVRLRMEVEEPLPEIWADPARMEQVLDNLVSNALHHTPAEGEIVLSARAAEGGVELCVRDSGAGMDAQTLPQIFERFYRADSARQNSASGLGLAITKSLVELHGGRIGAESPGLGQGSTFIVWMPARL